MKKTDAPVTMFQPFVVLTAGLVAVALGFVALAGWVLGLPLLASFGADLIPMAPSTAGLFVLYGTAICLCARTPTGRRAYWISVAMVCLGTLVALLLCTLGYQGIYLAVEHVGVSITDPVGGTPIGHMSSVAAFCFLLASVSFLASLSQSAVRPWCAILALGSAGVLLGICFLFLLAYLYGVPLLYGGRFIPPAVNTILAFVMLGLALLALASQPARLSCRPPGDGSRTAFVFVLIFLLLAMGIVAAGYIHYRNYEQHYRAEVDRQLLAVAELKVGELAQWRKERFGDAAILFKNPPFTALVRRFLEKSADEDAKRQLLDWMGKFGEYGQFEQLRLVDDQGVTHMTVPADRTDMASVVAHCIPEVLRGGEVRLQDFYRNEHDQRVYLAVMVPLFDERAGSRPLGVLVMRIDPETYLYPFIKRWPTPSPTAETLLVRREGNEVVFLNELRFQANAPLRLRAPLTRIRLPAAQAALGREGVMEGMDYRDEPVTAALRGIPDSPWSLVAKIDTVEVDTPMRERLWQVVVLIGALIFGAGTCVGLVWRQRRMQFYRERVEVAETVKASEARYRRLFEAAKDGILILDAETGTVADVNPFLIEMLGFSREQFLGKKIWELGVFTDVVANQDHFAELRQKEYVRYEDMPLETVDGRRIEVEFVSNVYPVNHHKVIQCNIRDITERKRAERQIKSQLDELHRWQDVMLDREDRVQELKREVNELCRRAGMTVRYQSQEGELVASEAGRQDS